MSFIGDKRSIAYLDAYTKEQTDELLNPESVHSPLGSASTKNVATEAEAIAGTPDVLSTAERVLQAIVAWWNSITGAFGRDLVTSADNTTARSKLGLGTAATRNVGESAGQVMQVGAGGVVRALTYSSFLDANEMQRSDRILGLNLIYDGGIPTNAGFSDTSSFLTVGGGTSAGLYYGGMLQFVRDDNRVFYRSNSGTTFRAWVEFYHTGNTTKNPDGTLKATSPVINLYTNKHDLHNESQFGGKPTVTRKSKGVYEITGTLGLRSEGWYLDTPSDRNGNKYFNVEWTQNITPDAEDGVVDEYRDDIVVTIETFERVWNKETGMFDNGDPMDINDLQDRFVQLRFNELKVEHELPPEPETEENT